MEKCIMGIDPSINSTGICIYKNEEYKYFIITNKLTKKQKQFSSDKVKYLEYDKKDYTDKSYIEKENCKTFNIYNICKLIKSLCIEYDVDIVVMEGVSYGSNGSVVDLAGLNFSIRMIMMQLNIIIQIIAPTELKKFAVANGGAHKEQIIDAWLRIDVEMKIVDIKKKDDIADAFFLAMYGYRSEEK